MRCVHPAPKNEFETYCYYLLYMHRHNTGTAQRYCYHAQSYGEKALHELQNLSTKLSSRYLLSLHMIYNLYKQVFDRIDINNGNFTSKELNPTPHEIKDKVLEVASSWQDGLR